MIYRTVRTRINLQPLTRAMNLTALALALILSSQLLTFSASKIIQGDKNPVKPVHYAANTTGSLPDIYYIILDGYAGDQTLKELFDYPNDEFISFLKKKGFYVAGQSSSNYGSTSLSLTSSANLKYYADKNDYDRLNQRDSCEAADFLKKRGYKIWKDYAKELGEIKLSESDDFNIMLMRISVVDIVAYRLNLYANAVRAEVLNLFDQLANTAQIKDGPKFIFVRIPSPHPPYVFGRNGESKNTLKLDKVTDVRLSSWDDKQAYLDQLIFISKKTKRLVDIILSESKIPPIIVLQADHGPHFVLQGDDVYKSKMRILNAYYLPGNGKKLLYPKISPVNTFRVIFNYYFGANYKVLPDRSYYSTMEKPFDLIDVSRIVN